MFRPELVNFYLPIRVRQTANTASVVTVWSMYNSHATIFANIKKISLQTFSDAAAPGGIAYELCRFSAAAPTGGAAITPIFQRIINSTKSGTGEAFVSAITDARVLDTGLTVAGITFETAFAAIQAGGLGGTVAQLYFDGENPLVSFPGFELAPHEGMCIRLVLTATAGQGIAGFVNWEERN